VSRFVAARSSFTADETADVLSLFIKARDRKFVGGIDFEERLHPLRISYSDLSPHRNGSLAGLWHTIQNRVRYSRQASSLLDRFRRQVPDLSGLRVDFDLPPHFEHWFWLRLSQVIWQYTLALAVLEQVRPRLLVSTSDNLPGGYAFHSAARQVAIPSLVIQHGFIGQDYVFAPLWADYVAVWGQVERLWYMEHGIASDRITVTGNPRGLVSLPLDQRQVLREQLGCDTKSRLAVWFTTPQGGAWKQRLKAWLEHPALNRHCLRIALKLHPLEKRAHYDGIPSHIQIIEAGDLGVPEAFAAADTVIHDYSSIGAEAQFCGQNVICTAVNPPYPDYYSLLVGTQPQAHTPHALGELLMKLPSPGFLIGASECLEAGGETAIRNIVECTRSVLALSD
jgi:hypothetical protein